MADASIEDWSGFLAFNLTSVFLCARAVLPGMLAAGRGHIVGIGSIPAPTARSTVRPTRPPKAGMGALVASIAKEYGSHGISSNGIVVGNAPFPNRTPDSSYLSGAMVPVDGGFHRSNLL
ncbi:SDR family oxidoreductase [Solwaraspora sp. WMMA2065]|uniref:SDR family oxidoreductase n=1 Tax=Solwaraspora sp. WMMA2065 TaxID=3015166 RepID=UPI00259B1F13|nr:SDR family oxidoreductase [Solwaraspora sp. WMMA2065]WJK36438.1 SDR family oxidoreductase [Solwaraspora sp. WMMA2065]